MCCARKEEGRAGKQDCPQANSRRAKKETKVKVIENQRFGEERALYRAEDLCVRNCRFEGEEDGESALKESRHIVAENCYMNLRYPFWHVHDLRVSGCELTEHCRAALWYDNGVKITDSCLNGIKALRECRGVELSNCTANSPEFGWKCNNISIENCETVSEYAFFESGAIRASGLRFEGKYSFQYTRDVMISDSTLKTKDAFWHAKDVTVTDSVIDGEYLGWYSEGLTLIRCHIKGTQPLCYCKRLRLIDCTMENCDLAFEYSDVDATVHGEILSVKNPRSGKIVADKIGEIIKGDSVYPVEAEIVQKG